MRALVLGLGVLVVGCGRIGFSERIGTDGSAPDPDAPDAAVIGWSQLVAYGWQTCGVFQQQAYCWGKNDAGQLGDGSMGDRGVPTPVLLPAGHVDSITQGEQHGCAIVDGTVYCYGGGFAATPAAITLGSAATQVGAGNGFRCAIANGAFCWGGNAAGQLGDGTTMTRTTPTPVSGPALASLSVADDHACGLPTVGGAPVCWGHNDSGFLGTGSNNPSTTSVPVAVTGGITVLPSAAGWHACALQNGEVWCWGQGTNGELGNGMTTSSPTPGKVPGLANVTALDTGGGPSSQDATCAIMGGDVWCWGMGSFGRLGNGLTDNQSSPVRVVGLPGPAVALALGHDHSCAVLADGDAWCWGRGDSGQLGDGNKTTSYAPVKVVRP